MPTRPRPRAPQPYDAKTHPLLWQHPTKKQTLLEFAARANLNAQAPGARPPPTTTTRRRSPTARRARLSDPAARRILPVSTLPPHRHRTPCLSLFRATQQPAPFPSPPPASIGRPEPLR